MIYLILQHPGTNKVYYAASDKIALAELQIACANISIPVSELKITEIAGVRYLSLEVENEFTPDDLNIISRLSFVFALFKQKEVNDEKYLFPVLTTDYEYIDSKISNILKYKGKTNEQLTKMMINVALLTSDYNYNHSIKILDPIAGKGTTLYEASVYGYDAYGIELEQKAVQEAGVFFKKYLQTEKIKHKIDTKQVAGESKRKAIMMQEFSYAKSKEEFKSEDTTKHLGFINGNSLDAHKYFKKELFNLIVGDLLNGIHQGNTGNKNNQSISRNPAELLRESLGEWKKVLKKGGVIAVAWNSFLVSRPKMQEVFAEFDFEVLRDAPYDQFEHMEDHSTKRDVVLAKKK